MSITYTYIKELLGKRVNVKLVDDSVIVNVKLEEYILNKKQQAKIVIKHNSEIQEIPIEKIKEIKIVTLMK
jgi:hypothetical protein